jgi:hypothetical protein
LEDLGVDGKILFNKYDWRAWNGVIWLRAGISSLLAFVSKVMKLRGYIKCGEFN